MGPVLFTIMVNDISPISQNTLMTKYADDITCSIPVGPDVNDCASEEVENIKVWAEENLMKLNLSKTKELVIRGRTTLPPPEPIDTIERVSYLKLLGMTTLHYMLGNSQNFRQRSFLLHIFHKSTATPTYHRNFALVVFISGRKFQNMPW